MSFTSWGFVFAFVLLLAVFRFVRHKPWQNAILLIFSWVFYAYGNWRLWFLLFGYSAVAWAIGLAIENAPSRARRSIYLTLGLGLALATLGVFKYLDFAIDIANGASAFLGSGLGLPHQEIVLPIGISFYTFQCSAYLIDIYRGDIKAERNFFLFALFKAFFPQLVAGPIERANHLLPQLASDRQTIGRDWVEGVLCLGIGYLLKVAVADTLDPMVAFAIDGAGQPGLSGATTLLGVGAFGLQIYGDFAGYSLIAVGLARLLGIRLTMNFNGPYLAASPSDFWRRWHISLSQWLRDYLYVPLGGNRRGHIRTYVNLLLTMALGGLWHGAAWNFVLWGVFHGVWLVLARMVGWEGVPQGPVRRLIWGVATFALVHVGWLLFRVHDVAHFRRVLRAIAFDFVIDADAIQLAKVYFPLLALVLFEQAYAIRRARVGGRSATLGNPEQAVFVGALALAVVVAFGFSGAPFIYFKF